MVAKRPTVVRGSDEVATGGRWLFEFELDTGCIVGGGDVCGIAAGAAGERTAPEAETGLVAGASNGLALGLATVAAFAGELPVLSAEEAEADAEAGLALRIDEDGDGLGGGCV